MIKLISSYSTITELAQETVDAMLALGLSPVSVWRIHAKVFKPIIRLHEDVGAKEFNEGIMCEYTCKVQERIENGEILHNIIDNLCVV